MSAAVALSVVSFVHYSYPRIQALYRFNGVGRDLVEGVEARRDGDRRVLVLVSGDSGGRWQPYGALMALTGPYLDTEVIAARIGGFEDRLKFCTRFPERQVIEIRVSGSDHEFVGDERDHQPSGRVP